MKKIALTQCKTAIVDDEDFAFLNQWKWNASFSHGNWYATRNEHRKVIMMHRVITECPRHLIVDHRDHDGLNNRRSNLRVCTVADNNHHKHKQKGSSRFKGVYWYKRSSRWKSQISCNGKRQALGYFESEESAARIYDAAARLLFGEFAVLNFPDELLAQAKELESSL